MNIFYYDVSLDTRIAPAAEARLEALIHGSENTVDPQTQETIRRTEFQLTADYRNGDWGFVHYKGMSRDLVTQDETQEEHDPQTIAPPILVTLLGLKIVPAPSERER